MAEPAPSVDEFIGAGPSPSKRTVEGDPDGAFWFTSGPGTPKSQNLAADPACVISVATHEFDVVAEGTATRVSDDATLQRICDVCNEGGWPARVEGGAFTAEFSAPAGPPPWYVYTMTPTRIFALGTAEPYGATRFDL